MNTPPAPDSPHQPQPVQRGIAIPGVQPRVTYILLGLIAVVYVAGIVADVAVGLSAEQAIMGGSQVLFLYGGKINAAIQGGQFWRLVTPIFLHIGLAHIGLNGYFLYIVGPQVERPFGYWRFLLVFLFSGIAGTLGSMIGTPNPSAGASGALFGLIGALAVYFYQNRQGFGDVAQRQLRSLGMLVLINLVFGITVPNIDNWGHMGGLVGGALIALLIGPRYTVQLDYAGAPTVVDLNSLDRSWWCVLLYLLGLGAVTMFAILIAR